ncbi:MAG: hypothetical protein ABIV28_04230 [Longimicrobiales bacterium]
MRLEMRTDQRVNNRPAPPPELPRRAEYWEHMYELFPGAMVLDDLEAHGDDVVDARWIIVRYTAVRAAALLLTRDVTASELRTESSVGFNHLRSVPMLDREAWSLKKLLTTLQVDPTNIVADALITAGDAACARGHERGAFAMYLLAYRLGVPRRWHEEAGRAARGIERVAMAAGAKHSPRLWRRRARAMEKLAAVA